VHSQSTQDGVLEHIFSNIGTKHSPPFFVEFGFYPGTYEGGSGANSFYLYEKGWRGLLLDGGNENATINLRKEWIAPETIVETLIRTWKRLRNCVHCDERGITHRSAAGNGVPDEPDYVNVDIDSADAWVFRAIAASRLRPRVFSVEYNSHYPPQSTLCNLGGSYRFTDRYDRLFGSSLGALDLVAAEFGYTLVDVVTGLDAFYVRNDLLKNTTVMSEQARQSSGPFQSHNKLSAKDNGEIDAHLCDYAVWKATGGDIARCKAAVRKQIKELSIDL
jgi:hypothetical protein